MGCKEQGSKVPQDVLQAWGLTGEEELMTELDSRTVERLSRQIGFLLDAYEVELARDPGSHATKSSRSNLIAVWHTIVGMYGLSRCARRQTC
jgi:hypothetical protein